MKKGAFLKENRKNLPEEQVRYPISAGHTESVGRPSMADRTEQRRRRIQKQHRKRLMLLVSIFLLLTILITSIVYLSRDSLTGTWHIDEVTAYQFNGRGKGALLLPGSEYEFTYKIEGNRLYIDFSYEGAKDAEYVFQVNGDTLTLNGGNATTKGEYVLTKDGK